MNHAELILTSLEKTSSSGIVAAALEAAAGAIAGGSLGIMQAREGRRGDPVGISDVSGAIYGGVLGALAGSGIGAVIRSSAVHRGVADDHRLRSMAEHIKNQENSILLKKMRTSEFAALQNRDNLSRTHLGTTITDMDRNIATTQAGMHKVIAESLEEIKNAPPGTAALHAAMLKNRRALQDLNNFNTSQNVQVANQAKKTIGGMNKIEMDYRKAELGHLKDDLDRQRDILDRLRAKTRKSRKEKLKSSIFGLT